MLLVPSITASVGCDVLPLYARDRALDSLGLAAGSGWVPRLLDAKRRVVDYLSWRLANAIVEVRSIPSNFELTFRTVQQHIEVHCI